MDHRVIQSLRHMGSGPQPTDFVVVFRLSIGGLFIMIVIYGFPPDLRHSGWHHPPYSPVLFIRHNPAFAIAGKSGGRSNRNVDGGSFTDPN